MKPRKKNPVITAEVVTATNPDNDKVRVVKASEWEDAHAFHFPKAVKEITILANGKPHYSIRFLEDGELILTGYATSFVTQAPQNLSLTPTRPL